MKSAEPNLRRYLDTIKNLKRIEDNHLNEILVLLRRDQLVDVDDAIAALKCCSSKHIRQTHVLDDIWTELKSKLLPINVQHYNALLRIYIEKGKIFSARAMFDEIIGRGVKPNVCVGNFSFLFLKKYSLHANSTIFDTFFSSTCNLLILNCAQRGDVNGARDILDVMQPQEIGMNEVTFNNLILAYANAG